MKHFYGLDWSASSHYHLLIKTGKWDIDAAAKRIVDAASLLKT